MFGRHSDGAVKAKIREALRHIEHGIIEATREMDKAVGTKDSSVVVVARMKVGSTLVMIRQIIDAFVNASDTDPWTVAIRGDQKLAAQVFSVFERARAFDARAVRFCGFDDKRVA